jgi:hypothetical protein
MLKMQTTDGAFCLRARAIDLAYGFTLQELAKCLLAENPLKETA